MSSKAIREYDAKLLLAYWLERAPPVDPSATVKTKLVYPSPKVAQVSWDPATNTITPDTQLPGWVFNTKLVAKPDQLIKRRGKAGLLALNKTWDEAKPWIQQRAGKPQKVRSASRSPVCDSFSLPESAPSKGRSEVDIASPSYRAMAPGMSNAQTRFIGDAASAPDRHRTPPNPPH